MAFARKQEPTNHKDSHRRFNKRTWLIFLAVAAMAVMISYFDTGDLLSVLDTTRRTDSPKDTQENMFYSVVNYSTSENVVEKSAFAFLNQRTGVKAIELESGIEVEVCNLNGISEAPIQRFSEYTGLIYMFDGQMVYRCGLDGKNVLRTVLDARKFEPMGDYIYALRLHKNIPRLFRYALNGASERLLFDYVVEDFWAYGGNLLMLTTDSPNPEYARFMHYNVVTGQRMEQLIPASYHKIHLDNDYIYYSYADGDETVLCRRAYNSPADAELFRGDIHDFVVGSESVAMLVEAQQLTVWRMDKLTGVFTRLGEKEFPLGSAVDVSQENCYVTQADGSVWISPVSDAAWRQLLPAQG